MEVRGALTPRQVAATVVGALPRAAGRVLYGRLKRVGWLEETARIPFDILESPDCPLRLRGAERELVRMALFGLPGQGKQADYKHREAIYQQRCAEIMREACDLKSLAGAAARALRHRDVRDDPVLQSMIRGFISQRETEFTAAARVRASETRGPAPARPAFRMSPTTFTTRDRVRREFTRLLLQLEEHLAHYQDRSARRVLDEMMGLRRRYPGYTDEKRLSWCEGQVARLEKRVTEFREQLEELCRCGLEAARSGDQEKALWIARRMSAIHDLLPAVMSDETFERCHRQIMAAVENVELQEVAHELLEEERAVAAEIKRLGAMVHRFHRLQQTSPPDCEAFRQAKKAFEAAVAEVGRRDREWLASLMLKLDALLDDLHDPTGRAEAQVDKFLNSVRAALVHIRREIQAIQAGTGKGAGSSSSVGLSPGAPPPDQASGASPSYPT